MKKIVANSVVFLGVIVTVLGIIGLPLVRDFLPAHIALPTGDQASHHYIRLVPVESQGPDFLPYVMLLAGIALLSAGVVYRRRLRQISANR